MCWSDLFYHPSYVSPPIEVQSTQCIEAPLEYGMKRRMAYGMEKEVLPSMKASKGSSRKQNAVENDSSRNNNMSEVKKKSYPVYILGFLCFLPAFLEIKCQCHSWVFFFIHIESPQGLTQNMSVILQNMESVSDYQTRDVKI